MLENNFDITLNGKEITDIRVVYVSVHNTYMQLHATLVWVSIQKHAQSSITISGY